MSCFSTYHSKTGNSITVNVRRENQNQLVVNNNALKSISLPQNIKPLINNAKVLKNKSLATKLFRVDPAYFGYK